MTAQETAITSIVAATTKLTKIELQSIYASTPAMLEMVVQAPSAISYIPLHGAIRGLGLVPVIKQEGQLDDGKYGLRLMIYVASGWQPPS
jgi:hypothetical protein